IVGLDVFHVETRARLNEVYEAFARGDYDARDHFFVDQYYGISQKVSNTWNVEYAVTFSRGPNNGQGHFGLNVSLNMMRFRRPDGHPPRIEPVSRAGSQQRT